MARYDATSTNTPSGRSQTGKGCSSARGVFFLGGPLADTLLYVPVFGLEYVSTYILGPTCAYIFYDTSQVCLHNTLGPKIAPNLHLCTRFLRCDPPTGPCSTNSYGPKCLHIHFRGVLTFSIQVEKCAYIFQGCLHILSQRRYGQWDLEFIGKARFCLLVCLISEIHTKSYVGGCSTRYFWE